MPRPPAEPAETQPSLAKSRVEALLREGWRPIAGPSPGPTAEDLAALAGSSVVMLGFGNQGRAHALNLRDAGVSPRIALRSGSRSLDEARGAGLEVASPEALVPQADLLVLAIPDHEHAAVNRTLIEPLAAPGATVGFMHGHSLFTGECRVRADLGVCMVAPKGPGTTLRERFEAGQGIPALVAVGQDPAGDARQRCLAWARGIGCGRSGLVETTFAAEAISDLFGEQTVLCGGVLAMIASAFEVLVEHGSPPELAYLECIHELKQVVDLVYARGPSGMRAAISETAEFGALEVWRDRDRLVDRDWLEARLEAIASGRFSTRMAADRRDGSPWLESARREAAAAPLEQAGRAVRALMPWLSADPSPNRSTGQRAGTSPTPPPGESTP